MWGEDIDEQRRRREWLRSVYDKATVPEEKEQTFITNSGFNQTPYQPDIKKQDEENFNHRRFLNDNSFTNISNSLEEAQSQSIYPAVENQQSNIVPEDVRYRIQNYNNKYQDQNPALMGLKSLGLKDWGGVINNARQGFEREADGLSLGLYTQINKQLGGNYQERKDNYHREADGAGIGALAKLVDSSLEKKANKYGLGRFIPKATEGLGLNKYIKKYVDDGISNAITEFNRRSNWLDFDNKSNQVVLFPPYLNILRNLKR